jgi:DNA repair/transcription protein MET18/MMS19
MSSAYSCTELHSQENTLLDVVQSLGEYINDEDSRIRGRAVSYLTAVLSALPPKFLSRQQIDVLCQFFNDRIEDGGAIEGLIKLQSLDRFTNEMAQTAVRA